MKKNLLIFGITALGSSSQAQNLQYNFQLSSSCAQLNLDFPVQSLDILQARDAASEFRLDIIVKAKVPQNTLQLLAQAGRYNMTINCGADGKCTLDAPNIDKKINLYGAEIQEQILIKTLAPSGVSGSKQQIIGSTALPSNLKVRVTLEGTSDSGSNYGISPDKPNTNGTNVLGSDKIGIE